MRFLRSLGISLGFLVGFRIHNMVCLRMAQARKSYREPQLFSEPATTTISAPTTFLLRLVRILRHPIDLNRTAQARHVDQPSHLRLMETPPAIERWRGSTGLATQRPGIREIPGTRESCMPVPEYQIDSLQPQNSA